MSLKPALNSITVPAELSLDSGIREAIQKVVDLTSPAKVIVFGSRVTGQGNSDSDLDVLIIVPDPVGDRRRRQNELRRVLARPRPLVDPWIMGECEFEETRDVVGGLAYPATHGGVLVYQKP